VKTVPRKIVVVGDAGLDVVAQHDGPIVYGGDVRAKVRFAGGGAGANTALWLRTQGAEPTLIARIGDDPGGRLIRAELEHAGIRCNFAVDSEAATCCVVVLVDAEGQRSMLPDRGANARFRPEDVDGAALAGAGHLHLSGYVLLDPSSRPGGLAALAAAKKAGLSTSVDPQSGPLITDPAAFLDDVRGVDLLLPNTEELVALNGATWDDPDGVTTVAAVPTECVDSTGAGDAFDAGILATWLAGQSTMDILRAGVKLGALAVSRVGAQP
jgi:sugar/nucleoside kinase (ribokinase family)